MDGRRGKGYIGSRTSMTVCLTWRGSSLDIGTEILNSSADDRIGGWKRGEVTLKEGG